MVRSAGKVMPRMHSIKARSNLSHWSDNLAKMAGQRVRRPDLMLSLGGTSASACHTPRAARK